MGRRRETQSRLHLKFALFSRSWVVLPWSLWYVGWKEMSQMLKSRTKNVLLIYPQTSAHLTGTFSLIPTVVASASHPSTLRKKAWWWTSISSPSPSQSLMTNTPSKTSLTLAMQVRHSFVIVFERVLLLFSKTTQMWTDSDHTISYTVIVCLIKEQIIISLA